MQWVNGHFDFSKIALLGLCSKLTQYGFLIHYLDFVYLISIDNFTVSLNNFVLQGLVRIYTN